MEINNQLIIDRLSQRMDLDRVYLVKYQFLDQEYQHLVLTLKPVSGLSHKILKPIVELCLLDQECISFELIFTPELKNKIKMGSLFYCYAALPKHEIFSSGENNTAISKPKEIRGILDLSDKHYQKVLAASAEFLQAAQTFAGTANYLRALFMVHQSLESHLKLLQVMVEGKGNNVHSLDSRIRSLDTHFSMFKKVFMGEGDEEKERFRLLDTSFNAVNQNRDLEISAIAASQLYDHCAVMQAAIEKLFCYFMEELQAEYEKNLATEAAVQAELAKTKLVKEEKVKIAQQETLVPPSTFHTFPWPEQYQSDIQQLLYQILRDNQVEQMMLLNYYVSKTHGKGLFDYPQKDVGNVSIYIVVIKKWVGQCYFRKASFGRAAAVISFLSSSFIAAKLNIGSRFSHTIWNDSVVLYRNPRYKPTNSLTPVNWPDTLLKTTNVWTRNVKLMHDLLAIFSDARPSNKQVAVLLLNQLILIGIHSYLYLRIGYTPMNATLEELVEWSCICDKKVSDFFTSNEPAEALLCQELLKDMKGRIHELSPELNQLEMEYFKSNANRIVAFFADLCEQSLRYMEMKSGMGANQN
ncbi:hypothetical protein [Sphingobacterium athyrii]|uniref:HEPN domain-containing protein n=1 Tax=Sphingobacterium athyrii TaxID=2152717 RepID=A0A363NNM6_9SPHI|nr:hypothetical protein [Sphingobacterium athyrii]PUV22388.1 hypothetical protein DCO56_22815 [Sphingobacterium athyrii]